MTDEELRILRAEMIAEYEKQWRPVRDSDRFGDMKEPEIAPNECGT